MKIELEEVPLPEGWDQPFHRGNTGQSACLREIPIGKSFTHEVSDERSLKELNALRNAITTLKVAKFGRRNFIIRLIENEEISIDGAQQTLSRKLYRVWAVPFPMEINNAKQPQTTQKGPAKT